jgi:L-ascorbate metabolism protein UlaG (beta-lactamase superfamily)
MQLTKYPHSCVRLEQDGRSLLIDPGEFSQPDAALQGVDVVLVTHEHVDHIDVKATTAAMRSNASLRMWAPSSVAASFEEFADRVTEVAPGQSFEIEGFRVSTHGGQHAVIHPLIPVVKNVGYLINDHLYHPGDSLIVPEVPVDILLVPLHAPWSKFSDVADFIIGIRAKQSFQIHDALLNEDGVAIVEKNIDRVCGRYGLQYRHLNPGDVIDI